MVRVSIMITTITMIQISKLNSLGCFMHEKKIILGYFRPIYFVNQLYFICLTRIDES